MLSWIALHVIVRGGAGAAKGNHFRGHKWTSYNYIHAYKFQITAMASIEKVYCFAAVNVLIEMLNYLNLNLGLNLVPR